MTTTIPTDDLVAHELEECVCGPVVVPIVSGEGDKFQITIHRRLDGHEQPDEPGS